MDRSLSVRLVVGSLLAFAPGCATERVRYGDDLVHTERPGYADAHAHNLRTPDEMQAPARWPAVKLPAGSRIVDLTHGFGEDTIYWPTEKSGFVLQPIAEGDTPGGWYYASNRFTAPEHGGTHLDAPIHFAENKTTADRVPLGRLIAPAAVIDMRVEAEGNPDALLQPEALLAYEAEHGEIVPGTIVLVFTGWDRRWNDRRQYLGDDKPGNVSALHFPGISEAAAKMLAERQVAAVGIDTASIDHGPSKTFMAHRTLMGADIPAFENVTHLELLPPRGALVLALPMKIEGGSGGPLRIVAVVPGNKLQMQQAAARMQPQPVRP